MNDGWRAMRLALRGLRREWRAGELHALLLALLVAVGSVTSVGFFTDRMDRAMLAGASDLLGADLLVVSTEPTDEGLAAEADTRGLETARTLTMRTALDNGERFELASLKAVSDGVIGWSGLTRYAAGCEPARRPSRRTASQPTSRPRAPRGPTPALPRPWPSRPATASPSAPRRCSSSASSATSRTAAETCSTSPRG